MAPVLVPSIRWEVMQGAYTFSQREAQEREWLGGIPFANFGETIELLYGWVGNMVSVIFVDEEESQAHKRFYETIKTVLDEDGSERDDELIEHPLWATVVDHARTLFDLLCRSNLKEGSPWPDEPTNESRDYAYVDDERKWCYYTEFFRRTDPDHALRLLTEPDWSLFWRSSAPVPLESKSAFTLLTRETPSEFGKALPYRLPPYDWLGDMIDIIAYDPSFAHRAQNLDEIRDDVATFQAGSPSPIRACFYQSSNGACFIFPRGDSVADIERIISATSTREFDVCEMDQATRLEYILNLR